MPKASQRKGRSAELTLAKHLQALGCQVRVHGQWEQWDLTVDGEPVEVKIRKNGYGMFYDLEGAGIKTVYCRADRKDWLKLTIEKVPPK